MTDETNANESETEELNVLYVGTCPSLSGASELTYEVGTYASDATGALHLRLTKNTGGGMFCRDPIPVSGIDEILAAGKELAAKSFHQMWPGKSTNNGGFLLAVVRDLGVAQRASEESRAHTAVAGTTAQSAIAARIAGGTPAVKPKKGRP